MKKIFLIVLILFTISLSFATEYKNEIIVKYKKNAKPISTTKHKKIKNDLYLIKVSEKKDVKKLLQKLKKNPNIEYAEPNYIVKKAEVYPNDTLYISGLQWGLDKINAPKAWELTKGSKDIYVAVVDTGVDFNHPDLKGNIYLNEDERKGNDNNCYNGVDDDGNGYIDDCYGFNAVDGRGSALDDDGHGTHLSGIIGALTNNNQGVAGVNWKVKIIPCKFLDNQGYGDIQDEVQCIEYIKSLKRNKGLNIVAYNASYGGEYSSISEKNALQSLEDEGIIFLAAAGNDGIETYNFNPCNYNLENEICVGAIDKNDKRAGFSNYNKDKVHIFSPGSDIYSTYKDSSYATADGTSQATPFVTGAVALLKSYRPNLTLSEIKRKLLLTGKNLINLSGYSYTCNRLDLYDLLVSDGNSIPKICLDKIKYDFGFVQKGNSQKETFTVRSTGEKKLKIYSIYPVNYANVFRIENDNCSSKTLSSLQECHFDIKINSVSGDYTTDVIVKTNIGNIPINVHGSSNYPPEIKSFTASPSKVDIGETVKYRWEIEDKDGDTLVCQIDFDGNGIIDRNIYNCASSSYSHKFYTEGTFTTKFYVTDGKTTVEKDVEIKVGDSFSDSSDTIDLSGCSLDKNSSPLLATILLIFMFSTFRLLRDVKTK